MAADERKTTETIFVSLKLLKIFPNNLPINSSVFLGIDIAKEAIEDDFIYCELMKYNEAFIEKIQKAKTTSELLKIWDSMKEKSFLNYNVDIEKLNQTIEEFKKLSFPKQQQTLFDLLNKNQIYVNLSEIEDEEFGVEEKEKKINFDFYKKI